MYKKTLSREARGRARKSEAKRHTTMNKRRGWNVDADEDERRRMDSWMNWWWKLLLLRMLYEMEWIHTTYNEHKKNTQQKHEQKFSSKAWISFRENLFPPPSTEISQHRSRKKFFIIHFCFTFFCAMPVSFFHVVFTLMERKNERKKASSHLLGWIVGIRRWDE